MSDTKGRGRETPLRPAALDPGTNVLVAGSALTRKRSATRDIGGASDRAGILVTTTQSAAQIKADS